MEKVKFGNGSPIVQKEYSIPPHMYDSAFKDFQRKFVYPRNYIMSAVFLIIAIIDIVMVATGKSPKLIIIALACIFVIFGMWIHTKRIRKNFVQSVAKVKDERQTSRFFEEGIVVTNIPKGSTDGQQFIIDFSKDEVKLIDKRYYFIVYVVKSHFFIIPKKVFDASEETMLVKCFQKKLGNNYVK